jgi:S-DNA-T family DNA segregation ATPase FtsK/SpoIIIE
MRLVLFTPRRSPAESAVAWDEVARGEDRALEVADRLLASLSSDDPAPGQVAVFIESVADFTATAAESSLDQLVRTATRTDQFAVGESESSTWSQAWTLAKPFKAGRRGLLLNPSDIEGDSLVGASLPRSRQSEFPPGRGYLAEGGKTAKLQVAARE